MRPGPGQLQCRGTSRCPLLSHALCAHPTNSSPATPARSALEDALSYDRFHPVYLQVKSYACCDVLNWLGGLWLGLLIVGCCGVPMALAAFWWLGRMDRLEPRGCVRWWCCCCLVQRRTRRTL